VPEADILHDLNIGTRTRARQLGLECPLSAKSRQETTRTFWLVTLCNAAEYMLRQKE